MEDIILIGFGGHGKSVADSIEREKKYRIVGYTDFEEHTSNYKYLGDDSVLEFYYAKGIRNAFIAIGFMGKGSIRRNLYDRVKRIGFSLPSIIDPSAIVSGNSCIAEGVFVGKGAIINADSVIEKMAIINSKALIEHENHICEFSHIAVGAVLCGNVWVGRDAFVGANATILQNRKVNDGVIIPAGYVMREK